jgi:hypothetical protein
MLLFFLDLPDRVAEVRDRFRGGWTMFIVGAVLIAVWIAFLLLETLWRTMTSRGTPAPTRTDAAQPEA